MTNEPVSVLILAAGLGTRLLPLTRQIPKPLVPIVDETILSHQVKLAKTLGNVSLHVNAHYLAEQIETVALKMGFTKVWKEFPEILGTGGPLFRFYRENGSGDLLVLNSDCYCRFDLRKFIENAKKSGADFALLGVDFPKINSLVLDKSGFLSGIKNYFGKENGTSITFSGVSWYSEQALKSIREDEKNIVHFWKRQIENGMPPWVDTSQKNSLWIDMGTPQGLFNACRARLEELKINSWIHPEHPLSGSDFIRNCTQVVIQKKVKINPELILKNAVLLDGALVEEIEYLQNEIRGLDFCWSISQ